MNRIGIHHRDAHSPNAGIASLQRTKEKSRRTTKSNCRGVALLYGRFLTRRAVDYGLVGLGGIGGTIPPDVDAVPRSSGGASPHVSFTRFQSGTCGSGHNRAPITG